MKSSIKSIHAIKGTFLIKTLFACLIVAAFSFAAIPAWAGDAEADAKQALENLKGAIAKVDKAKEDLKTAQEALDKARGLALKDGKLSASEKELLQTLANEIAKAEAALKAAEDEFYKALRALEDALEKLKDDSEVKKELERQRGILLGSSFGTSRPQVVTANGLRTVNFGTLNGQVTVNLPDDMRAGDTISGTVIAEPKGQTPEQRTKNAVAMKDDLVAFFAADSQSPKTPPVVIFDLSKGLVQPDGSTIVTATFIAPKKANVGLFSMPNQNHPIGACGRSGSIVAINESCSPISQLVFESPDQGIQMGDPPPTNFTIPTLGQTGRPLVITGPFDGNAANTILYAALRTSVQDFEKNTENVSGGFGLLAESHSEAVFQSSTNVTGPIEIRLNEGNTQTTGTYRNVGVNLTAPKTSLLKGESTELHVQVSGLEGIKMPVPLTLESHGVITMEGGTYQPLVIQPSQVGPDGRYSTTRGITGVQAGGWGATATVVTHRFDVCLQNPTRDFVLVWNTFSGEYAFINHFPPRPPGQPPQTGSTTPPRLTGTGKITMKGCVFTLEHNAPDRTVMSTIDQCSHTGSASVQTSSPKMKFTITDRNMAGNTCVVQ